MSLAHDKLLPATVSSLRVLGDDIVERTASQGCFFLMGVVPLRAGPGLQFVLMFSRNLSGNVSARLRTSVAAGRFDEQVWLSPSEALFPKHAQEQLQHYMALTELRAADQVNP